MMTLYMKTPLYASLLLTLLLSWHTKTCRARNKCSCSSCLSVEVSPSDQPHSVWDQIDPKVVQTQGCTQVSFVAKDYGHVCLQQIKEFSKINDSNVEMIVNDGSRSVFILKYYPNRWQNREICSESNSLTFELKKLNVRLDFNPELVSFYFQVVHIESSYRKLYLEDSFCGGTYKLINSSIQIFSKFTDKPELNPKMCGIYLEKDYNFKNMCLFYTLQSQPEETFKWEVFVSIVKYSLEPKDHVFSFNANSSRTDAWCSDISSVMVILKSAQHKANLFNILARDFNGTKEDFLDSIDGKKVVSVSTTSSSREGGVNAHVDHTPLLILPILLFIAAVLVVLSYIVLRIVRSVCKTVTKKTAYSNSVVEPKPKLSKKDILVIVNHYEQKNLLSNL